MSDADVGMLEIAAHDPDVYKRVAPEVFGQQPSPYSEKHAEEQTVRAAEARKEFPCLDHPILKFFAFSHLPPFLQAVSKPFADLAIALVATTPPGAEQSAGLRKLLEAKDCFVRSVLP